MRDARLLAVVLADPGYVQRLTEPQWATLLTLAHAERLSGSLAHRLDGLEMPEAVARVLDRAKRSAEAGRQEALWEVEMTRRALANVDTPVILLKGSAFVAAGMEAGQGRQIGDLDILVPKARLDDVERALISSGWSWLKPDAYDDHYYRTWMHELPPLVHVERGRLVDVHHTILPPTARFTPDAAALIANAVRLKNGLYVLAPEDMVIHAVVHLLADGDLAGGLRNLWDIERMVREFSIVEGFWQRLIERSRLHSTTFHLSRALRLCHHLFQTPVDPWLAWEGRKGDIFYTGRLLARNGWGQETRGLLRFAFYVRSHWIRMPPLMLARHLFTKWRKAKAQS